MSEKSTSFFSANIFNSVVVGAITLAISAFGVLLWDAAVISHRKDFEALNRDVDMLRDFSSKTISDREVLLEQLNQLLLDLSENRQKLGQIEEDMGEIPTALELQIVTREVADNRSQLAQISGRIDLKSLFVDSGVGYVWLGIVGAKNEFVQKAFIKADGSSYLGGWNRMPQGSFYIYNREGAVRARFSGEDEHWNEVPKVGTIQPDSTFVLISKPILKERPGNSDQKNAYAKIVIIR